MVWNDWKFDWHGYQLYLGIFYIPDQDRNPITEGGIYCGPINLIC